MSKKNKKQQEDVVNEVDLETYLQTFRPYILDFADFNEDNYQQLIMDLNDSSNFPNRELYLKSQGGDGFYISPVINLIENSGVKLKASSYIYSSAFITFFEAKCQKEVLNYTNGMFHYPFLPSARLHPNKRVQTYGKLDEYLVDKAIYYNVEFFEELLGITKKKHKMLEKGGELVYDTNKLRKLLEKSNKMLGL